MKAVLTLQFEREEPKYVPGEILKGTVVIESNEQWKAEYGEVALRWIAQKDKLKDESVVEGKRISMNSLIPPNFTHPFSLKLPITPWSYEGHLFNIKWVVSALIRPKNDSPIRTEREIFIHPPDAGCEVKTSPSFSSGNREET